MLSFIWRISMTLRPMVVNLLKSIKLQSALWQRASKALTNPFLSLLASPSVPPSLQSSTPPFRSPSGSRTDLSRVYFPTRADGHRPSVQRSWRQRQSLYTARHRPIPQEWSGRLCRGRQDPLGGGACEGRGAGAQVGN
uniref:Uncharacterized protein n=1 Tax=Cryptococcus bacillisporus CA1280 TaxID=1296109 RepID=A0A0D0VQL4_CRYGA|nr:hypothetical protein I312_01601 [Cryptococcus bacillisporus CA1280]